LQEYQKEGFDMFQDLMNRLDADIVEKLYTVQLAREEDVERLEQKQQQRQAKISMTHGGEPAAAQPEVIKRDAPKVGRNDPCVCGSGRNTRSAAAPRIDARAARSRCSDREAARSRSADRRCPGSCSRGSRAGSRRRGSRSGVDRVGRAGGRGRAS
jgi:hypothetical protein